MGFRVLGLRVLKLKALGFRVSLAAQSGNGLDVHTLVELVQNIRQSHNRPYEEHRPFNRGFVRLRVSFGSVSLPSSRSPISSQPASRHEVAMKPTTSPLDG